MNVPNGSLNTKRLLSFTFNARIDKVYDSIFNPSILKQSNIVYNIFEIENSSNEPLSSIGNIFILKWHRPQSELEMIVSETVNKPDYKSISHTVTLFNNILLDTNIIIFKYELFLNSCENSTVLIVEVESSPYNPFKEQILNMISSDSARYVYTQIKEVVMNYSKDFRLIDSILIHRSITQVNDAITNIDRLINYITKEKVHTLHIIGRKGEKGSLLQLTNNKSKLSILYELKEAKVNSQQMKFVYEKKNYEINSIYSRMKISLIKISNISSILIFEYNVSSFLDSNRLLEVSAINQMLLIKIKKVLESTYCYEE